MAMVKVKIKKNDRVVILTGRDKGKQGRVIEVLAKKSKVIVEGLNMLKNYERANPAAGQKGGIIPKEAPIHISNVMLLEGGVPTRVGRQVLADGRIVRIAKKSGNTLD